MSTPNLIIGTFFIVLSIIISTFPNTIAGYNTLSNEEKKKIKVKQLAKFVFKVVFSVGIIIIIGNYIFTWLKVPYLNYIFHPILYILMLIILFSNKNKYIQQD